MMNKNKNHKKPTQESWDKLLSSISRLQKIILEEVLVGGSAAAIYAKHRFSTDHYHVISDLKLRFNEILEEIEGVSGWKTARVQSPVQILGSLDGIETGIRQLKRTAPLETQILQINGEDITIPTIEETLRIKTFLALTRNATRDYLDVIALSDHIGDSKVYDALFRMDELYPQSNGDTWAVRQQIIKQFSQPKPYDLDDLDLTEYKGMKEPYTNWDYIEERAINLSNNLMFAFINYFESNPNNETNEIKNLLKSQQEEKNNNKPMGKLPGLLK